jgi:hypothetical protein
MFTTVLPALHQDQGGVTACPSTCVITRVCSGTTLAALLPTECLQKREPRMAIASGLSLELHLSLPCPMCVCSGSEWGEALGEACLHWQPTCWLTGYQLKASAQQWSSGAWSQLWRGLGLGDVGPLDRPPSVQGGDGPQLSGPAAHWGPLYAACPGRVDGIPQEADGVQKLVDSMLSGLWLAQAPVCTTG